MTHQVVGSVNLRGPQYFWISNFEIGRRRLWLAYRFQNLCKCFVHVCKKQMFSRIQCASLWMSWWKSWWFRYRWTNAVAMRVDGDRCCMWITSGKWNNPINNVRANSVTNACSVLRRTFNLSCAGYQTRHQCCVVYRSAARRSHSLTCAAPTLIRFTLMNRFIIFIVRRAVDHRSGGLTEVAFIRRHRCCLYSIV